MAIRPLLTLLNSNVDVAASTVIHAGDAIARDTTTGLARQADRANDAQALFLGFAADDSARTGNTFINVDPVGSTVANNDGTLTTNNNGYFVSTKRALGDYQQETVTNISDLTSGSTGYQGPRRGLGFYNVPGASFVTDRIVISASTSSTTADGGGAHTPTYNDLYTFGAGANAGQLVYLASSAHGLTIARIDKWDATQALATFTAK